MIALRDQGEIEQRNNGPDYQYKQQARTKWIAVIYRISLNYSRQLRKGVLSAALLDRTHLSYAPKILSTLQGFHGLG